MSNAVELIGAMTWPINVAEELRDAQLLGELKQSRDFTTLIDAQRGYKASIIKEGVLRHMMSILAGSLQKGRRYVGLLKCFLTALTLLPQ